MRRRRTTTSGESEKAEYLDSDEQGRLIREYRKEFVQTKSFFEGTIRWLTGAGMVYSVVGPVVLMGVKGRLNRFSLTLAFHGFVAVLVHVLNLYVAHYENKPRLWIVVSQWILLCLLLTILLLTAAVHDEEWLLHLTLLLWYWGTAIMGTYVAASLVGLSKSLNDLSASRYKYRTV